jgi:hypothetical protein
VAVFGVLSGCADTHVFVDFHSFSEVTMRSDLNEFVTKYLAIVGATVMAVGFVAFVVTAHDENRADTQPTAQHTPALQQPASTGS